MLQELAHTAVQSNDHLSHKFYETVGTLGAKLALILAPGTYNDHLFVAVTV
jgi:hypothetical protein